ncbi:CBS domain-containing protein [Pseudobacteriovorax antillogorgiicola]|uniref:CBS domain-containing protein n=1 Tax=Pseudobacteriovorax antillogorgiicola TaxID=1513793 RepID=A0A1Y6C2F0_9BACT|nr:CBS domain-containing protein [Pseudobacteriovorax antillogorgiicola]TCS52331.1 CBS domain protein [Pseudobacteriovorax antillogorgiicola]SMF29939.1 CBS domain-containing protein [Pseudobacteriovorax antillogorgiicola]
MEASSIISPSVIIAHQSDAMEDLVNRMIDDQVSSVLVVNDHDEIVGIVTERDIVRKFTLISKADKLKAKVITVMTRPVSFVRVEHLEQDIAKLHQKLGIRHFPVLSGQEPQTANLVGMLTSTDMFRIWVHNQEKSKDGSQSHEKRYRLTIVMSNKISRAKYRKVFESMDYSIDMEGSYEELIQKAHNHKSLLLFDLDDDYGDQGPILLTKAISTGSHVIFLTQRLTVAGEFKKRLKNPLHHIMIKPLELSYLEFLLEENKKLHLSQAG